MVLGSGEGQAAKNGQRMAGECWDGTGKKEGRKAGRSHVFVAFGHGRHRYDLSAGFGGAHTPPPQTSPVWASVSLAENKDNPANLSLGSCGVLQMKDPLIHSFICVQLLLQVAFCLLVFSNLSLSCCSCGLGDEK